MKKYSVLRLVAVAVAFVSLAGTGLGLDRVWVGTGDGTSFLDTGNWEAGVVPGAADRAVFTNSGTYTISISTPITNDAVWIARADITFNTPGSNYTVNSLNISNVTGFHSKLTLDNGTTVVVGNASAGFKVGNKDLGDCTLTVKGGSLLAGAQHLSIGHLDGLGVVRVVVSDSGSVIRLGKGVESGLDFAVLGVNSGLIITNGGGVSLQRIRVHETVPANRYLARRALISVGGGSPESLMDMGGADSELALHGSQHFGDSYTTLTNYMDDQIVILPNGRVRNKAKTRFQMKGRALTMVGGEYAFSQDNGALSMLGAEIRGYGRITGMTALRNVLVQSKSYSLCHPPWTGNGVTNFGSISPGLTNAPIGEIIMTGTGGYLEVQKGCRFNFDLAGTSTNQYDRIVGTNAAVYLGTYANPYTVQGGAIVNVALTNNFVPVNGNTFDVLVCSNIMDDALSSVIFNMPTNPANLVWTASIVTNIGLKTETLRLSVSGGRPTGTLFLIN